MTKNKSIPELSFYKHVGKFRALSHWDKKLNKNVIIFAKDGFIPCAVLMETLIKSAGEVITGEDWKNVKAIQGYWCGLRESQRKLFVKYFTSQGSEND